MRIAAPDCRIILISGLPRSGTTLAQAVLCASPEAGPLSGEASYFRLLVEAGARAEALFDVHTRYLFDSLPAFQSFHRDLLLEVLNQHHAAALHPSVLVLKDPLLTRSLALVRAAVPEIEHVLVLRHPADVLASQTAVRARQDRTLDPEEFISQHNSILHEVLDHWGELCPTIISYQQLDKSRLQSVWHRLSLQPGDAEAIWAEGKKKFPDDALEAFLTPLYGRSPRPRSSGRLSLARPTRDEVGTWCLPVCRQILRRAGSEISPYWQRR